MTASRSPPPTSNAPGTCCRARRPRSCASTRARPGIDNLDEVTDQRRLRGHVPPEAAAAGVSRAARLRLCRRSIPAMCRRRRCGSTRSAPARSNSSSSSRTSTIKVARNPDYWKPGRPYLDGIEYTIITNRSTAILAFVAGKFDMTFAGTLTIPLMKDIKSQAPQAICEMTPANVSTQPDHQPRQAAVRQSRTAAGDGAERSTARPSSTS